MGNFEAWVANCHLRNIHSKNEYHCQAAVWADGYDTFRARLSTYVEKQGYHILWIEEVLSTMQYLKRHGNIYKIGALARAVHPGYFVKLSPMIGISDGKPEEPKRYLFIKEIKDIEPLDGQYGEWPLKTVPDKLLEPLFGELEPAKEDIAQYGSAKTVLPIRTYAIVHPEKFQRRAKEIKACGLPLRCLFKGEAAEERKDEAPYLIELKVDADFTRRLFTHDPKMPDDRTSVHLWQQEPGMYLRSRANLDDLWQHFRYFTRFQNENGKWFHFRFWEATIFPAYWKHFSASYARVARFFCFKDFTHSLELYFIHDNVLTHIMPDIAALKTDREKIPPFSLTSEDHAFFQAFMDEQFRNKVKNRLLEKLNNAPKKQRGLVSTTVDTIFSYIKERNNGAFLELEDCFTLALLVILWGDTAEVILKGPLLNDPLIPISQRIALTKETYFETMGTLLKRRI